MGFCGPFRQNQLHTHPPGRGGREQMAPRKRAGRGQCEHFAVSEQQGGWFPGIPSRAASLARARAAKLLAGDGETRAKPSSAVCPRSPIIGSRLGAAFHNVGKRDWMMGRPAERGRGDRSAWKASQPANTRRDGTGAVHLTSTRGKQATQDGPDQLGPGQEDSRGLRTGQSQHSARPT